MPDLVLLRHGESTTNLANVFTGWTDVDLTAKGVAEAHRAGQLLRQHGFRFDVGYTSVLKRTVKTMDVVLEELDLLWISVQKTWRLNERFYGALQGQNKAEAEVQYGAEQVQQWRRDPYAHPPTRATPATTRATSTSPPANCPSPKTCAKPWPACCPSGPRRWSPPAPATKGAHLRPRQQPAGAGAVPRQAHGRTGNPARHRDRRANGV